MFWNCNGNYSKILYLKKTKTINNNVKMCFEIETQHHGEMKKIGEIVESAVRNPENVRISVSSTGFPRFLRELRSEKYPT